MLLISSKDNHPVNFLRFVKIILYIVIILEEVSAANNFCNNCQCCSSNQLIPGQYSGKLNEIHSNSRQIDHHLHTSPSLTFSVPNAKPIPLIEAENGLQKFYKIDYNGIESLASLNPKSNSRAILLPIPVAALILPQNGLSQIGCNCLTKNTLKPRPIIEEDVPEVNGCESRCEKCTNNLNENEESEGDENDVNNCCEECQNNNFIEKSRKEESENKGQQQQFYHQEPANINNKIPLEIFKNFVAKNRDGFLPSENGNTFHEESIETLKGRLKDISDKMDLLKQLNAEMRSPLQTQNHRTFPLTKPLFYEKEELDDVNKNSKLIDTTQIDKQSGMITNNNQSFENQQKQLFFAPSRIDNEQTIIKNKIISQNKINNTSNTEEINKNGNIQRNLNFEENNLQKNNNGQKMLFNVIKDIIQQKKDFEDNNSITKDEIIQDITKYTVQPGQNINYLQHEDQKIFEQKNNQIPTVPKSILLSSHPITNLNYPEQIITTFPNKTIELLSPTILKENNNSLINSNQEIKILEEIKNITPIDYHLFPTLPPFPLNAQQQFLSKKDLKAENDPIKDEIKSTNILQSIPINIAKDDERTNNGVIRKEQNLINERIENQTFENLNNF